MIILFLIVIYFTPETDKGTLKGKILDRKTKQAVSFADIHIKKIDRWKTTDKQGSFIFHYVEFATYNIYVSRLGYQSKEVQINFNKENSDKEIIIYINEYSDIAEEEIVEADRYQRKSEISESVIELSGKELRKNLGATIAETISNEPGIDQRTMGPTPARPVLRGLGNDRLAILEDGSGTGDLSATAADHAVVIEPINSERIEIIRGPESLLYGSNTVAGVVNVVRNYVPTEHIDRVKGSFSSQAETVSSGFSSAVNAYFPVSWNYHIKSDFSYRKAGNVSTPKAILKNTDIKTYNASFGNSFIDDWGYIGFAASLYKSDYGIPPDPVTGHVNGVRIDLERQHFEFKFDYHVNTKLLHDIKLSYNLSNYFHAEIESRNIIGMEFGVVTQNLEMLLNFKDFSVFENSRLKIWSEKRDYNAGGLNLTPNAEEYAGSVQLYTEINEDRFLFNSAIRFDERMIVPNKSVYSNDVGLIKKNKFSGLSFGIGTQYRLSKSFELEGNYLHTFRAPVIEELFKKGPHLSAYSFDVGNANLSKETADVFEIGIVYQKQFNLTYFFNRFDNYIYSKNTGINSFVISDLPLYKTVNQNVDMQGFEFSFKTDLSKHLEFNGHLSYVEGKLKSANPFIADPFFYKNKTEEEISEIRSRLKNESKHLPQIPPLKLKSTLNYKLNQWNISGTLKAALEQNKLAENEEKSSGYFIFDLFAEYNFVRYDMLHSASLNVSNLFNTEYRNHLNRIKHIMPEAGRNIRLLYKIYF